MIKKKIMLHDRISGESVACADNYRDLKIALMKMVNCDDLDDELQDFIAAIIARDPNLEAYEKYFQITVSEVKYFGT